MHSLGKVIWQLLLFFFFYLFLFVSHIYLIWQILDKGSVKSKDLEARLPGLKSLIYHLLTCELEQVIYLNVIIFKQK